MKYSAHQIEQLFKLCEDFIADNNISCAEVIHQNDLVIESAYKFIEQVCDIVGYDTESEQE